MLQRSDKALLSLNASAPDGDTSFDFHAPRPLSVGRYTGASRYPFQEKGWNGFAVSGHGFSCNELAGSFEVKSLSMQPEAASS